MELALKWTGIIFTILGGIFTALGVCLAVFTGVLPLAMFAGFGLVFLLPGIGMLWARTRARARRAKLLEEGQRIDAGIIAVDWDTRFRVNGRCPLVIRCQAVNPVDGCVYVFQSEAFWFDPSPFLEGLSTLPVYVDGDNYRRYAVDTQGIVPKQG